MSTLALISAEQVVGILREREAELHAAGIRHLSLFGSVARGDAEADSDIDLAVVLDSELRIGLLEIIALERRMADLLGRKVDLVPEPVEKQRLQANLDRDRIIAF